MGWWLTAAGEQLPASPPSDGTSQSIVTALIAVLGTVLVALITVGLPLLFRRAHTSERPLGERVAVVEDHDQEDRRTLDQLDRHVDGIGEQVEELRDDMDTVMRHLGLR